MQLCCTVLSAESINIITKICLIVQAFFEGKIFKILLITLLNSSELGAGGKLKSLKKF